MFIFQGYLSDNCIKECNKRLNLTALFISLIFIILGLAVSITMLILKIPEYLEILILTIILLFIIIFLMFSKPSPLLTNKQDTTINLDKNQITQICLGNNLAKPKIRSINKIKKIIDDFDPDIVIGTGGYVTYPVIKAAKAKGIKTFIHEQNSIPGKSNKMLAKLADKIGVSFKDSIHYFDENKTVFTGNPCSERALSTPKISRAKYGLSLKKKFVLMVQGSLGSTSVNDKMLEFLNSIDDENYEVLYITGKASYDEFSKNKFSKNVFIVPYVENLAGLMKDADVIISRAGASSISEIIALKKLSILIPSPYVANNHQFFNALSVANNKAGVMIEESALTTNILKHQIKGLLEDLEKQVNMRLNLTKMQKNDSSTKIYETIKELVNK